jgi:hypothetical protein
MNQTYAQNVRAVATLVQVRFQLVYNLTDPSEILTDEQIEEEVDKQCDNLLKGVDRGQFVHFASMQFRLEVICEVCRRWGIESNL